MVVSNCVYCMRGMYPLEMLGKSSDELLRIAVFDCGRLRHSVGWLG